MFCENTLTFLLDGTDENKYVVGYKGRAHSFFMHIHMTSISIANYDICITKQLTLYTFVRFVKRRAATTINDFHINKTPGSNCSITTKMKIYEKIS